MKQHALSLLSLLGLFLMGSAAAQTTVHMRANVPFNFAVGSTTLPAGTYNIQNVTNTQALLVKSQSGEASMIAGTNSAEGARSAKSKLVFHKYGSQYFLAEIWTQGSELGRQVPPSNREKELAKELASNLIDRRVEVVASLY
jgi:hypothetical protein